MNAPIQIKNPESVRLIREWAELSGQPITEAVTEAVKEALGRRRQASQAEYERRLAALRALVEQARALPVVGPDLTDDELYDEDGLPK